jgi:23S rRNA-intervening sequence protein
MCDFRGTESETGVVCESVLRKGDRRQNTGDGNPAVGPMPSVFSARKNAAVFGPKGDGRSPVSRIPSPVFSPSCTEERRQETEYGRQEAYGVTTDRCVILICCCICGACYYHVRMKQPAKNFQDLLVWQKAHEFVLATYRFSGSFPKAELFGLTSQLRRASVSIPANIAEGFKKRGIKDKLRLLNVAQGSAEETPVSCIPSPVSPSPP